MEWSHDAVTADAHTLFPPLLSFESPPPLVAIHAAALAQWACAFQAAVGVKLAREDEVAAASPPPPLRTLLLLAPLRFFRTGSLLLSPSRIEVASPSSLLDAEADVWQRHRQIRPSQSPESTLAVPSPSNLRKRTGKKNQRQDTHAWSPSLN